MRHSLLLGAYVSWHELRPSKALLRKTALMLGIYAVLTLGTFAVVKAATAQWMPRCAAEESLLMFPVYDARGVETGQEYHCGKARKACTVKEQTARGPVYECPGLMRPR
jgi:hypothetical protein